MVNITHTGESVEKANIILKVAQKRFGLYGLDKTSMKEIASDIGISKASLYYYFPDKEHLFMAVVEMEQESFSRIIEETIKTSDDPIVLIKKFVKTRLDYFKTFFNLSRLRFEDFKIMKPLLNDTNKAFSEREEEQLIKILQMGIDKNIFYIDDIQTIASLFLESLKGLRTLALHNKELMYVEQEDYDLLVKKQYDFTDVFIKGIMYKA